MPIAAPRTRSCAAVSEYKELLAGKAGAAVRGAVRGQEPHDGEEHLALARARLAHDAEALPARHRREVDPSGRGAPPCRRGCEVHAEAARLRTQVSSWCASAVTQVEETSRSASPSRFRHTNSSTRSVAGHQHPRRRLHLLGTDVDEIAETGARLLHAQAEKALETLEQNHLRDGEGGVDDDSVPRRFGMMWRARIAGGATPSARAASMNSRRFSARVSPRTMRAVVSHPTAPSDRSATPPDSRAAANSDPSG